MLPTFRLQSANSHDPARKYVLKARFSWAQANNFNPCIPYPFGRGSQIAGE
jgi:hypothetical protein